MSLLEPTDGGVFVDEIEVGVDNAAGWKSLISHVPQSVF